MAARIKNHEDRIERLESLEFHNIANGIGCIDFLDYIISGGVASLRVDVPPNPYSEGDYGWTNLKVFYAIVSGTSGTKTLHVRFNNFATAFYGYTYKYAAASAGPTVVSADAQSSIVIGRLLGAYYTVGRFEIPLYSVPLHFECIGDYVANNGAAAVGSRVEKGDFGGVWSGGTAVVNRIDVFASAGNIAGYLFLYGWCPRWVEGSGPPD